MVGVEYIRAAEAGASFGAYSVVVIFVVAPLITAAVAIAASGRGSDDGRKFAWPVALTAAVVAALGLAGTVAWSLSDGRARAAAADEADAATFDAIEDRYGVRVDSLPSVGRDLYVFHDGQALKLVRSGDGERVALLGPDGREYTTDDQRDVWRGEARRRG